MRASASSFGLAANPAMLGTRVLTAVVLIPCVLAALFLLPPVGWGAASLLVIGVGASEWARLAGFGEGGGRMFVSVTLAIGGALLAVLGTQPEAVWRDGVVLVACGISTLFWLLVAPRWLARRTQVSSALLALTGWAVLIGAWVAVVELKTRSAWLLLAAMAIVWIADTAAYFAGRRFGRRKLAPEVSPGKTWEGVYGALAAVAIYALALVPYAKDAGYTGGASLPAAIMWIAFAFALAALSIVGDLYESLLKRQAGVKDSGTLLPGHGGVLDRIDALLAAMPPAALLAWAFLR